MSNTLLFFCIFCIYFGVEGTPRLVGGDRIPIELGKFHASLQNVTRHHVCGGAIISQKHVVTAAHCVFNAEPKYIHVVIGTANLDNGGLMYSVESVYVHDDYNSTLRLNDIAILKIRGLFNLCKAKMLRLDTEKLKEGDNVTVVGFGAKKPNGESARKMNALNLTVFSQETCQYAMRYTRKIYDSMFCTFTGIGQGTCHGDSGGPLVKDNKLVGIVSWGIPCAVGFPDVHTRIQPYIPWIQNIMDKVSCGSCRK
ncbi:Serine protease P145 [Danaus plexippus plexippus]|uniref:Serine protease P145 n=1 Tax=Danaus plexippus plexippus TaxID=278856 RepID=A0A212EIV5_DANPL|nr:Serine protease P145 [Danaus plexippus plexippus]